MTLQCNDGRIDPQPNKHRHLETIFFTDRTSLPFVCRALYKYTGMTVGILDNSFKNFPEFAGIIYRNYYCRRLMGAVRRKRHEKWKTPQLVSRSQQCSCTPVCFGQVFLIKEQCDNPGHPPLLSWLTSTDFYLFPRMKLTLKGRCYCHTTDIIKNATEELKRTFKKWLPVMFVTPLQSLPISVWLPKRTILKEI